MKNEKTVDVLFACIGRQNEVSSQLPESHLPYAKKTVEAMIAASENILDKPISVVSILTIQRNHQSALMKVYFDAELAFEDEEELFAAKVLAEMTEERLNRILNSTEGELDMLEQSISQLFDSLPISDEIKKRCDSRTITLRELLEACPELLFGSE